MQIFTRVKTPTLDLNKLSMELEKKDFVYAIKLVLTENVPYQIIKCELDTRDICPVFHVDVVAGDFKVCGEVISTYIPASYTMELIKKAELLGYNLETSPESLIDVNFIYCGEVEFDKGNTYSKLEFNGGIVQDYSDLEEFMPAYHLYC